MSFPIGTHGAGVTSVAPVGHIWMAQNLGFVISKQAL